MGSREHPLLMRGPLVVASLAGIKTQTRRLVAPSNSMLAQPNQRREIWADLDMIKARACTDRLGLSVPRASRPDERHADVWLCPRWRPGDEIWIREAWQTGSALDDEAPSMLAAWARAGGCEPCGPLRYVADGTTRDEHLLATGSHYGPTWGRRRPGIHMPRWACRLVLEVTAVRVERVQDITEEDARAEGVTTRGRTLADQVRHGFTAKAAEHKAVFRDLWVEINGQRPGATWAANPWVWAITYRRVEP